MRGCVLWTVLAVGGSQPASTPERAPRVVLWAWEHPQDLGFLASFAGNVGIAYLAATLRVGPDGVALVPRRQPMRVAPGTPLTAVVRLEPARGLRALGPAERDRLVDIVRGVARMPGVSAVQLDCDAPRSFRAAYAALLGSIRAALPPSVGLSMTALASWCMFDDWLDSAVLPVDDAVPMVFSMGREGKQIRARLSGGQDFLARRCQQSLGLATYEPAFPVPRARRLYLFHDGSWTAEVLAHALVRFGRRDP